MDRLSRKIELPLARHAVEKAGLYLVPPERYGELARVAEDAYRDYPLHVWLSGGTYDPVISRLVMEITLKSLEKDAVIYADSEELNGFAVWVHRGFTGNKVIPFLRHGGFKLLLHAGPGIIGRLLTYESFAMKLKKKYTAHRDWYLYNLSVASRAQGQGIGGKLLRPMLEFCDRENAVGYLETNKEANVDLYRHFGFQLGSREKVPHSQIIHCAMVRQPVPVKKTKSEGSYDAFRKESNGNGAESCHRPVSGGPRRSGRDQVHARRHSGDVGCCLLGRSAGGLR